MSEQETVEVSKEETTQEEQNGTAADDTNQAQQESGEQAEASGEQAAEQTEGGGEQTEGDGEQAQAEEVEQAAGAEDGTREEAAQETETQEETQAETQEETQAETQEEAQAETQEETQEEKVADQEQAGETAQDTQEETPEQEEKPADEGQTGETPAEQSEETPADQTEETPFEQTGQEQADDTQAEQTPADEPLQNGEATADLQLTEEQQEKLKRKFQAITDTDRIDFKQFKCLLRQTGQNPTHDAAKEIYDNADLDGNGTISFEEFCRLYQANRVPLDEQEAEIVRCLNKVFPDESQPLELKTVEKMITKVGMGLDRGDSCLSNDDLKNLVKKMDTNGDGKIDRTEFAKMLVSREMSTV